jgi:hypothetical protein
VPTCTCACSTHFGLSEAVAAGAPRLCIWPHLSCTPSAHPTHAPRYYPAAMERTPPHLLPDPLIASDLSSFHSRTCNRQLNHSLTISSSTSTMAGEQDPLLGAGRPTKKPFYRPRPLWFVNLRCPERVPNTFSLGWCLLSLLRPLPFVCRTF